MLGRRKFLQLAAAAMITAATVTRLGNTKLSDCIGGITEANLLDYSEAEIITGHYFFHCSVRDIIEVDSGLYKITSVSSDHIKITRSDIHA